MGGWCRSCLFQMIRIIEWCRINVQERAVTPAGGETDGLKFCEIGIHVGGQLDGFSDRSVVYGAGVASCSL